MKTKPAHQGARGHTTAAQLLIWMILLVAGRVPAQTIVAYQSDWKYLQNGVVQNNTSWTAPTYNDGSWATSKAPFGFGSNAGYPYNTTLQRGPNNSTPNYPVFYFRKTFSVTDASAYGRLRLRATLDDGIVIYIGGVEIARKNMTPYSSDGYAGTPVPANALLTIDTLISASLIRNGNNVIAVELHQTGNSSSDIYFDAQLDGVPTTLFRYPYLQLASHNRITVCWYTTGNTNATVRYSTNPNMATYQEVNVSTVDTLHMVTLLNLTPDTRYYYSVGYKTASIYTQLQYNSSVNYFHTQPNPSDTTRTRRFWLLGDSGAGKYQNPRPYKVRDAYLAYLGSKNNPDVDGIIFLGDNSNTQPYEGLQLALDTTLFKFYNRPNDKQLLSHIPSWTVIGNHDYEPDDNYVNRNGTKTPIRKAYHKQTAASFSTFAYPDSAQIGGEPTYNKKGYYSFNQGNIHFVVLNPPLLEVSDLSKNWERKYNDTYYDLHSFNSIALNDSTLDAPIDAFPQVQWLIRDLLANKQKWTVVTFHLPPFSTIGHIPDKEKDLQRVRDKLLPILEKPEYHVDAVIVSHSHAYERAGMIRKKGNNRTSDYTQTGGLAANGNLGRYPASKPYIKSSSETAYTYVLSGSAGRGWYNPSNTINENDAGFPPGTADVNHPRYSNPPLDNLTGNEDIDFYHIKGGSVELVFQETRLDVKFIRESDTSPMYSIADSFVVMKDVNKKKTITIQNGGDAVNLTASWIGTYNWYSAQQPGTVLASGTRTFSTGPRSSSTFYVRDQNGYLADTFIVNVTVPSPVVADTLFPYKSQWLYPLSAGIGTKGVVLAQQCVVPWSFSAPAFELPVNAPIGIGHNDETHQISRALIEKVVVPAEKLWFRRSFILNGSVETYANFKLTLLRDKNLDTRRSYSTSLQSLLINGQAAEITATETKDITNGREEVTYTVSNRGFTLGLNYLLVSYYLTPLGGMVFPINPADDPFTFDGFLTGTPLAIAPPPLAKQFKLAGVATDARTCSGDTVSVTFTAVGNESGFPITYEARIVTPDGDIPVGEGSVSPIIGMLPGDLPQGSYLMKVATKNAFMADQAGPAIAVSEPAQATIPPIQAVSVWKGEKVAIPVRFTGTGPWKYTLPDSSGGTCTAADTILQTKTKASGAYTLTSVGNGCGNGQISGSVEVVVKEPIVSAGKVTRLSFASWKTALCNGDSIAVDYLVTGPDKRRTYAAEISDVYGNFTHSVALASSAANPLMLRLPASLAEGDQYRIRVKAIDPDVDFTSVPTGQLLVRKMAEAEFSLNKMAVYEGEELELSLLLSGTLPIHYHLRLGTDIFSEAVNDPVIERTLKLNKTTVFSLDSVRNVCGYGAVSGSRTVTVSLVVGVDPLLTKDIIAYPNPATQTLLLKSKQPWQKVIRWRIVGSNGQLMRNGAITTGTGAPLEIDLSLLPAGLYILELDHGTPQSSSWKIVKK